MKNRRTNSKPKMTAKKAAALLEGVDVFNINFLPLRSDLAEAVRFGINFEDPQARRIPNGIAFYLHLPGKGFWAHNQQIGWIPIPASSPSLQFAMKKDTRARMIESRAQRLAPKAKVQELRKQMRGVNDPLANDCLCVAMGNRGPALERVIAALAA